ncbi:MAG: phage holin family protein [Deltaproteobacteria bacterium]|nr:phage holin family protein [Deltaproteobacteria bacterium]
MFDPDRATGRTGEPGILHGIRAALAVLSAMLHTRLDLFVTELEEERERLKQTLVFTLLLFFGLSFGFILLTIFIVALFWDKGWIAAIGCLSAVYLGVGIAAGVKLKSAFLTRPGLFPATLGELGKDRDRLRASSRE